MDKNIKRVSVTLPDVQYVNHEYRYRRVRGVANPTWGVHREVDVDVLIERVATFDVEVDLPKIIEYVLARAMSNKSGKAAMLDGMVVVKRRGAAKEIGRTERQRLMSDAYERVPEISNG